MRVLGIEFAAARMTYALLDITPSGYRIITANRLTLADTRSVESIQTFQEAARSVLVGGRPDKISIRKNIERGPMSAGAAALKMEAILLANSSAPVQFVTPQKISRCAETPDDQPAYINTAFKAAICAE